MRCCLNIFCKKKNKNEKWRKNCFDDKIGWYNRCMFSHIWFDKKVERNMGFYRKKKKPTSLYAKKSHQWNSIFCNNDKARIQLSHCSLITFFSFFCICYFFQFVFALSYFVCKSIKITIKIGCYLFFYFYFFLQSNIECRQ